jgi:hypothetical protein
MGQTTDKVKQRAKPTAKPQYTSNFVNFDLDTTQIRQCKAWELEGQALLDAVMGFLDDGYSLTVSVDERNKCYMAVARPKLPGTNENLLLSGRGSTPAKAAKQLLFKHDVLEGDWTSMTSPNGGSIDD